VTAPCQSAAAISLTHTGAAYQVDDNDRGFQGAFTRIDRTRGVADMVYFITGRQTKVVDDRRGCVIAVGAKKPYVAHRPTLTTTLRYADQTNCSSHARSGASDL
jgi:hypothetical protein